MKFDVNKMDVDHFKWRHNLGDFNESEFHEINKNIFQDLKPTLLPLITKFTPK